MSTTTDSSGLLGCDTAPKAVFPTHQTNLLSFQRVVRSMEKFLLGPDEP
jgi:hypothetical protein